MVSKIKQLIVYTKVVILALVVLAVAWIVFKNRAYKTNFWPWADGEPVSTLWLMLATAVSSVVVFWILARTRRVFKELTQLRVEQAAAMRLAEQERLKNSLDEQERRIDEKLKRAVGEENSQS